jgi:mono/diheme cytochrome c family protein
MRIRLAILGWLALAGAAAAALLVASGVYNIAATEQHTLPVYRLLEYGMQRSVKLRAAAITVPDLTDPQRLRNGFALFRDQCVQCHGAPGVAPEPFALGLTPAPANLVGAARESKAAELFWVIKYGIKMSGMPAWKYRMSEGDIWDVVAFVDLLPALSPREYADWGRDRVGKEIRAEAGVQAGLERAGPPQPPLREGSQEAGQRAITQYLCATCHVIPGIVSAEKQVGPPLNGIATRKYIAGILPNNPENLVAWLRHPQRFAPHSAMPDLGLGEQDARDIAAYLSRLEDVD